MVINTTHVNTHQLVPCPLSLVPCTIPCPFSPTPDIIRHRSLTSTNNEEPMSTSSTRRRLMQFALLTIASLIFLPSFSSAQEQGGKKKVLFLTKSSGFQHDVVRRNPANPEQLAPAERFLTEIAGGAGYEVTCTKDADVFNDPKTYETYQVIAFYTTEDLTQPSDKYTQKKDPATNKTVNDKLIHTEKAMSAEGKQLFLQAIESGKVGFIGFHCASDTFHSKNRREPDLLRDATIKDPIDPYIGMVGGEFAGHGRQQNATMKFVSSTFPGLEDLKDFTLHEEWYNLKNLAPDMHVILVQDTTTMQNPEPMYKRAPFPATWARMHGKGRVFYTSMGHKPEVWKDAAFQKIVVAGLNWTSGKTEFDPKSNLKDTAPQNVAAAAAK
jgi:uncharacterized protein